MKSVLLVDDEADIVEFMQRFMRRLKIRSAIATTSEQALEVFKSTVFDCVFLDLHLGNADGFQVLKQLRELNPSIKVVIITGNTTEEASINAKVLGAIDYICKPLDLGELKGKVDKYLLS